MIALAFLLSTSFFIDQIGSGMFSMHHSGYPFVTNYSSDDYNAHIQNWGLASDSNGVLHIANMAGVLRYDGVEWQLISVPNYRVLSIASDQEGGVFVGGQGEIGYLVMEAQKDSYINEMAYRSLTPLLPDTLNFGNVWNTVCNDGVVYFQTSEFLFRYDGQDIVVFPANHRFTNLIRMNGTVYTREYGTGISQVTENGLLPWTYADLFAEIPLQAYVKTPEQEVFCSFHECFSFYDGELEPFAIQATDYLGTHQIHKAQALSDGTIVIATRSGGIVHLDQDGELTGIVTQNDGLISNAVFGLYEDASGALWAATINGLSRVELQLPLRRFDERMGIDAMVMGMAKYQMSYFYSTPERIYELENDGNLLLHQNVRSCGSLYAKEENLYAICENKLYHYDETQFKQLSERHFSTILLFMDHQVMAAIHDAHITFFQMRNGEKDVLYRIENPGIKPRSAIAHENDIWIASVNQGVFRLGLDGQHERITGHVLRQYDIDGLTDINRNQIHVTKLDNEPAFLTWGRGIMRFDEAEDSFYQVDDAWPEFSDPDHQYFRAVEDPDGNIWARAEQNYRVHMPGCEEKEAGMNAVLSRILDRQNNGIYPDPDGYIWFLTNRGIIRLDKERDFMPPKSFYTAVKHIYTRADSLVASYPGDNGLYFPYKENELRFTFNAATYDEPHLTEYRVKLDGFDTDWSTWSTETWKDYTNISEGSYRFLVEARNVYGVVSEARPVFVVIHPPWYRTWWAYILYVSFFSGILYLIHRIRLQQLLRIERIRNKIAGDLHDEVSATLSSISFFAQAIGPQKLEGGKDRFLALITESAGEAKEKISDIVWAINPEHDDWKSFLSRCRRYASDLFESKNMAYSLRIDERIPGKLDMQLRQHLWLIFKEMVTNTARHSKAEHVHLVIQYTGGKLTLLVQDDGIGIQKVSNDGNGLKNIKSRANEIGAKWLVESDVGMGTRCTLTMNY